MSRYFDVALQDELGPDSETPSVEITFKSCLTPEIHGSKCWTFLVEKWRKRAESGAGSQARSPFSGHVCSQFNWAPDTFYPIQIGLTVNFWSNFEQGQVANFKTSLARMTTILVGMKMVASFFAVPCFWALVAVEIPSKCRFDISNENPQKNQPITAFSSNFNRK